MLPDSRGVLVIANRNARVWFEGFPGHGLPQGSDYFSGLIKVGLTACCPDVQIALSRGQQGKKD